MFRRILLVGMACVLVAGLSAAVSAATTEEVLAKITKQRGEVKTFEFDMSTTMKGADIRTSFSLVALHTTLGCTVIAVFAGRPTAIMQVSPRLIIMLALSGWICIGLAHVFYYTAIHRIGVAVPTAVLQLVPFAVACMSYLIFGETFTGGQLGSGVILVVHVFVSYDAFRKRGIDGVNADYELCSLVLDRLCKPVTKMIRHFIFSY